VVHLKAGDVKGIATDSYRSFRGIPYAEPPLGELRFAPPKPKASWAPQALDATDYRHNCLQPPDLIGIPQPRDTLSEDCLFLNVFTPANASPTSRLPVFFWVHGGGCAGGGGNESRLNGTFNAALDSNVVVVTINYRYG
jgi:para-nitrobenzyl esterase